MCVLCVPACLRICVYVCLCAHEYVCVSVCVWRMTDFGMCGWLKQRRWRWRWSDGVSSCVLRREWGAGPWNKSIPNGRETDADGREKGGLAAECHSAPADIVLRARTCFSSSSIPIRVLYCFIAAPCRHSLCWVSFSLFGRPWRPNPLLALATFYTNAAPTKIFTLRKKKTIV